MGTQPQAMDSKGGREPGATLILQPGGPPASEPSPRKPDTAHHGWGSRGWDSVCFPAPGLISVWRSHGTKDLLLMKGDAVISEA